MNRFSLNYPPSIDNCRPRKKAKVHWFFTFMLLFSSMPPYIDPKNRELSSLLEYKTVSHPPRNSRRTFAEPNEFSLCVVAMTMPTTTSGKKVRQYRIKVFSTPRWSSRYNRVVPSATLAQVEKSFFLFPTFPSHRAQGEEENFPFDIFLFFSLGEQENFLLVRQRFSTSRPFPCAVWKRKNQWEITRNEKLVLKLAKVCLRKRLEKSKIFIGGERETRFSVMVENSMVGRKKEFILRYRGLVDDYIVLSQQYCLSIAYCCRFGTFVLFAKRNDRHERRITRPGAENERIYHSPPWFIASKTRRNNCQIHFLL